MLTSGCVIALAGGLAPGQNNSTLGSVFDMVSEVYAWCADVTSHWATVYLLHYKLEHQYKPLMALLIM